MRHEDVDVFRRGWDSHIPLVIDLRGVTFPHSPAAEVGVDLVVELVSLAALQQARLYEGEGGIRGSRDRARPVRHHGAVADANHGHPDGVASVRTLEARVDPKGQLKGGVVAARTQRDEQAYAKAGDERSTLQGSCSPV